MRALYIQPTTWVTPVLLRAQMLAGSPGGDSRGAEVGGQTTPVTPANPPDGGGGGSSFPGGSEARQYAWTTWDDALW